MYVSAEGAGYRNRLSGKESQSFEDWQAHGETISLELLARARGVTVADLTHASILWQTDDKAIAEVFGNGRALGKKPGITRLALKVLRNGAERSGFVHVLVEP